MTLCGEACWPNPLIMSWNKTAHNSMQFHQEDPLHKRTDMKYKTIRCFNNCYNNAGKDYFM
jgi:hypothetical protein